MKASLNWQWLSVFLSQVVVGLCLTVFGAEPAAQNLGLLLLGGAFGQGVTAQTTAKLK